MIQFYTTPLLENRDITPVLQDDIDQMRAELQAQDLYDMG